MQVVILAGGLATRLGSITQHRPKSMVEVHGKPFLEYQVEFLGTQGISDILVCIGYLGGQIKGYFNDGKRFGVSIKYSQEERLLGTAGALKKAKDMLEDLFFTMYGDSYPSFDFPDAMRYFKSQNKLALMSVYKNYDRYDRSNTAIDGSLVKKFSKKEKPNDMPYIEYGINIFKKKALELIPEDQPYSLDDLFPRLIEMEELLAYEVKERFYEIGSPQGLKEFEQHIIKGAG